MNVSVGRLSAMPSSVTFSYFQSVTIAVFEMFMLLPWLVPRVMSPSSLHSVAETGDGHAQNCGLYFSEANTPYQNFCDN